MNEKEKAKDRRESNWESYGYMIKTRESSMDVVTGRHVERYKRLGVEHKQSNGMHEHQVDSLHFLVSKFSHTITGKCYRQKFSKVHTSF